jgi:nitrite reductase/ring-hydroxylating ferredoxin subunit
VDQSSGSQPAAAEPESSLHLHMAAIADAVQALEAEPATPLHEHLFILLEHIDALHRSGLTRLLELADARAGTPLLERLVADPVARDFLEIYGLVPGGITATQRLLDVEMAALGQPIEAIEVADVADGTVEVRIVAAQRDSAGQLAALAEQILQQHLPGFRQIRILESEASPENRGQPAPSAAAASSPPLIPLTSVRRSVPRQTKRALWVPLVPASQFGPGELRGFEIEGQRILVGCLKDGPAYRAYEDRCPGSALPLSLGSLEGGELVCPWHGCRFNALTGQRVGRGPALAPLPVEIGEDGRLRVRLDVTPEGQRQGERPG